MPSFCRLQYKKRGRPGRIYHVIRAVADVTYCTIDPVAIGFTGQTEQKEGTDHEFRERSEGERTNPDVAAKCY